MSEGLDGAPGASSAGAPADGPPRVPCGQARGLFASGAESAERVRSSGVLCAATAAFLLVERLGVVERIRNGVRHRW